MLLEKTTPRDSLRGVVGENDDRILADDHRVVLTQAIGKIGVGSPIILPDAIDAIAELIVLARGKLHNVPELAFFGALHGLGRPAIEITQNFYFSGGFGEIYLECDLGCLAGFDIAFGNHLFISCVNGKQKGDGVNAVTFEKYKEGKFSRSMSFCQGSLRKDAYVSASARMIRAWAAERVFSTHYA